MATSKLFQHEKPAIRQCVDAVRSFLSEAKENKTVPATLAADIAHLDSATQALSAALEIKKLNSDTVIPIELLNKETKLSNQAAKENTEAETKYRQLQEEESQLLEALLTLQSATDAKEIENVVQNGRQLVQDNRLAIKFDDDIQDIQKKIANQGCLARLFSCCSPLKQRLAVLVAAKNKALNPDNINTLDDIAEIYSARADKISEELANLRKKYPQFDQLSAIDKDLIRTDALIQAEREQQQNSLSQNIMLLFMRVYECLRSVYNGLVSTHHPLNDKCLATIKQVNSHSDQLYYKANPKQHFGDNVEHFHKLFEGASTGAQNAFLDGKSGAMEKLFFQPDQSARSTAQLDA